MGRSDTKMAKKSWRKQNKVDRKIDNRAGGIGKEGIRETRRQRGECDELEGVGIRRLKLNFAITSIVLLWYDIRFNKIIALLM